MAITCAREQTDGPGSNSRQPYRSSPNARQVYGSCTAERESSAGPQNEGRTQALTASFWTGRHDYGFCRIVVDATAFIGVIGVLVVTPLIVRQVVCGFKPTGKIRIAEPRLTSVRAGQPSQGMIKRSILHHHEDDVFNTGSCRVAGECRLRPAPSTVYR